MKIHNASLSQIQDVRFHQVYPISKFKSDILDPLIKKLSEHIIDNQGGILTLEVIVIVMVIVLGITIIMVIKQEVCPRTPAVL